ncbi:MAG: glycosyl hydrolase family 28-related protein [Armatimonadota bacterium]
MKYILIIAILSCMFAIHAYANPMVPSKSVNAVDYGVKADGVTASADSLQKAIGATGGGGGAVHLPSGVIILDKTITIPDNVVLVGDGASWENTTTTFHVKHKDGPAFKLFSYCGIKGVAIYYPDNLTDEKMIKPDVYPPAVELWGCNVTLDYINFDGPWIAVSSAPGGANAGQCLFTNINGFAHHRGFHMSGGMDINRFENIHWFPSRINRTYEGAYFAKNLVAFEFGRQDGVMMSNCFIIGGKAFFHQLQHTDKGAPEWAASLGYSIIGCWVEDVEYGFIFEGVSGFTITGSNILVRKDGIGIKVNPECLGYNAVLSGVQIRGFGEDKPYIGIDYNMQFQYWQPNGLNKLTITDCQIQNAKPAIRLGEKSIRAFIKGNLLCGADGYPSIDIKKGAKLFTIKDNIFQVRKMVGTAKQPTAIIDASGKVQKVIKDNMIENL